MLPDEPNVLMSMKKKEQPKLASLSCPAYTNVWVHKEINFGYSVNSTRVEAQPSHLWGFTELTDLGSSQTSHQVAHHRISKMAQTSRSKRPPTTRLQWLEY